MKRKKKTIPGSIYVQHGKIYIKFKGIRYSTGLSDSKFGYEIAEKKLQKIYLESQGLNTKQETTRIAINDAFKAFKQFKEVTVTQKTLSSYEVAYKAFASENYPLDLKSIENNIQQYIKTTKNCKLTINNRLRDFHTFIDFCVKRQWIEPNTLTKDYKQQITSVKENIPYTDAEIAKIIDYFRNVKHDIEFAILIEFMLETGARDVDCLTLEREQIKEFSIVWKNKKTKINEERPVSDRAIELLAELSTLTENRAKIFRWSYNSLSSLCRDFNKVFKILNIEKKNRSFQEFRVTFRMRCLENGIPEHYTQYLMRHSSITTTKKHYTYHEQESIRKYLNLPSDKMTKSE